MTASAEPGSPLLRTRVHECAYVEGRRACLEFVSPSTPMDGRRYQSLLTHGFRRSGPYVYRPVCPECAACRSLRIPVATFRPRRRHRRCLQRNADVYVQPRHPALTEEHLELYHRYLAHRHEDSSMRALGRSELEGFLTAPWCPTLLYELRDRATDTLLAVAVTDLLPAAISAVYTFFEPEEADRSPGNLAILWQIHYASQRGASHVYLGYWIPELQGMAYKADFRPAEYFEGGAWNRLE